MADVLLRVSGLAGPLCTVVGRTSWSVREVKEAVEDATGIDSRQQRLLLGTTVLRDNDSVAGICDGSTTDLSLVQRSPEQVAWLRLAETEWSELLHVPKAAWEDREVVLAAAAQCGWALAHAADRLCADREVVLTAVRQSGLALRHAAPELKADREVVLEAIKQCGKAYESAAPELRTDREFALEAVGRNGRALEHVGAELAADREIVLAAVRQCGCALNGAAPEFRRDYELVTEAVEQDGSALAFAAAALRADPELKVRSTLSRRNSLEVPSDDDDDESTVATAPDSQDLKTYSFGGGRADAHAGMARVLGRKGAHLCEMASLGLPVSPGFCVAMPGHKGNLDLNPIGDAVKEALAELERSTGRIFGGVDEPLLLSVMSGSLTSDAGELANIGLNDDIAEAWSQREGAHFVWDSYRRLIMSFARGVKGLDMEPFEQELTKKKDALNAKCMLGRVYEDCDIPARDLRDLVAIYQDLYLEQCGEAFPQDPVDQLADAISAVVGANDNGGKQRLTTIVQAMVFGNYDSLSAVGTAKLQTGDCGNLLKGEWLTNAQMDDVFMGTRKQQKLTEEASRTWAEEANVDEGARSWEFPSLEEQMPGAYASLVRCQDILRSHIKEAEGVEFVVQQGQLYIRQPVYRDGVSRRASYMTDATLEEGEDMFFLPPTLEEDANTKEAATAFASAPEANEPLEEIVLPALGWSAYLHQLPKTRGSLDGLLQRGKQGAPKRSPFEEVEQPAEQPMNTFESNGTEKLKVGHQHFTDLDLPDGPAVPVQERWHIRKTMPAYEPAAPWEKVPELRLPLWQTALAGGAAGFAAALSGATAEWGMRSLTSHSTISVAAPMCTVAGVAAAAKAAPRGMICTTAYVNYLSNAANGGSLDGVSPLARFGCAAGAAATALTIMHGASAFYSAAVAPPRNQGGPLWTFVNGSRNTFAGLPMFLRANLPVMAIELCAIDIVKNLGTEHGYTVTPPLLVASGMAAGAVSQTILNPLGPVPQLAGHGGGWSGAAKMAAHSVHNCKGREIAPLFQGLSPAYMRSMFSAGANSLVRVGLVTQFLSMQNGS